jgi:2-methylisocitrate lyase-like PEP mutase family enzyme
MTFHDLHDGVLPLLLPNAWDVPSALALIDCGFTAIGTTSFGVASAQGSPDGVRSTSEANLALARALARLDCYVSMDVEDGYADDPDEVAAYVAELTTAGTNTAGTNVAGVNIEDSTAETLIAPADHAAKVRAVKQRSPGLFVNARVDTYWLNQDANVAATIERAEHYVEAGADGIFVPGATEPDVLAELTSQIDRPVNVLAIPGRSLADLARLGVRRVSTGSLPYRAAVHAAAAVAVAVRDGLPLPDATPYADLQNRLTRYAGGNPPVATGPQ